MSRLWMLMVMAVPLVGCSPTDKDTDTPTQSQSDTEPDVVEDTGCEMVVRYTDGDSDGYGDPERSVYVCLHDDRWVDNAEDCDDSDGDIYPDAPELCDDEDQDCDAIIDEDAIDPPTWWLDGDGDGYGAETSTEGCDAPTGYAAEDGDCDDTQSDTYPEAPEQCDERDQDCDERIDEEATDALDLYPDDDGDGYGDSATVSHACEVPSGSSTLDGDCNDADDRVHPAADEVCDGIDNDCDDAIDTADTGLTDAETYYLDADGDGYGDGAHTVEGCSTPSGYADLDGDCDTGDPDVHPNSHAQCWGSDDVDCDGLTGEEGLYVPDDYPAVQDAIDAGTDGDHVCIDPGTYTENLDLGGVSMTLMGTDAEDVWLDGDGTDSVVVQESGDLTLQDLTVTNGEAENGAGLYLVGGSFTLSDVVLTENHCTASSECNGGGLYVEAGELELSSVTFSGNTLEAANAYRNSEGAGLKAVQSTITGSDVSFEDNESISEYYAVGGGMHLDESTVELSECAFTDNVAEGGNRGWAGAFWTMDSSVTLEDCTLSANAVYGDTYVNGAAIYGAMSDVSLRACTVTDHVAESESYLHGGVLNLYLDSALSLDEVTVTDNTMSAESAYGGVLHVQTRTTVEMVHTVIADNTLETGWRGGSLLEITQSSNLEFTNSILAGNEVSWSSPKTRDGAGINVEDTGSWGYLENADVVGNTSEDSQGTAGTVLSLGGNGGYLEMVNVNVSGNGSGVYSGTSVTDFRYCNFYDNGDSPFSGTSPVGSDGNISVAPQHADTSASDAQDWDLTLDESSALIDSGDTGLQDVDGTRSDIGAFGGPDGDWTP